MEVEEEHRGSGGGGMSLGTMGGPSFAAVRHPWHRHGDRLTAVLSARVATREKGEKMRKKKELRLTCGSYHTLKIERMNGEAVGVNNKFNLLFQWKVGQ